MSVELMGKVWKIKLSHSQQSVLLAMADFANDDGRNCYPSHRRLAWKTGYSERQVSRIINELIDLAIVKVIKLGTNNQPPRYWIRVDKGTPKEPYKDDRSPDEEESVGGDKLSPQGANRGDRLSPQDVAFVTPRGDSLSPDPLVNHQYKQPTKGEGEKPPPSRGGLEDEFNFDPEPEEGAPKAPKPGPSPTQRPKSPDRSLRKVPAGTGDTPLRVYHEFYPLWKKEFELNDVAIDKMNHTITDLALWREVVEAWAIKHYEAKNIGGQLEWYSDPDRFRSHNGTNNKHSQPNYERPPSADFTKGEWDQFLADPNRERGPY